jgi:hypothetical protein
MNPDVSRLVDPQTAAARRASQGRLTHTRFIQDPYVGVKCMWKRWWRSSHRCTAGALWAERLSQMM